MQHFLTAFKNQKVQLSLALCFLLASVTGILHYTLREDQHQYGSKVQFPELYVYDSFFEVLPLVLRNKSLLEYREPNYDRIRIEHSQEIQRKLGTDDVEVTVQRGLVTITMFSDQPQSARKTIHEATEVVMALWNEKIERLTRPVNEYLARLNTQSKEEEQLVLHYEEIASSPKKDPLLTHLAQAKVIELKRLNSETTFKAGLISLSKNYIKKPMIIQEPQLVHVFKRSLLKSFLIFCLVGFVTGGIVMTHYLTQSNKP